MYHGTLCAENFVKSHEPKQRGDLLMTYNFMVPLHNKVKLPLPYCIVYGFLTKLLFVAIRALLLFKLSNVENFLLNHLKMQHQQQ